MRTLPTLDLFLDGAALRDQGIARAEAHASRATNADWSFFAYTLLDTAITGRGLDSGKAKLIRFQTADFRKWAENRGLPPPPDARAYGGIIKRAVKAGLIVADGYAPTQDPIAHNRPAVVWKVAR